MRRRRRAAAEESASGASAPRPPDAAVLPVRYHWPAAPLLNCLGSLQAFGKFQIHSIVRFPRIS